MFYGIVQKGNNEYFLGEYKNKNDIKNIILISQTFSNINDFCEWYPNRKEVYRWMVYKCRSINISCEKIIRAIYDGYYGDLYNNKNELEQFIDDFKYGYEI